jgi:hypothetical protein
MNTTSFGRRQHREAQYGIYYYLMIDWNKMYFDKKGKSNQ